MLILFKDKDKIKIVTIKKNFYISSARKHDGALQQNKIRKD